MPRPTSVGRTYFDLIAAASSARFFCHASYSAVPGRGGTSFGIPPSHVGTLSATTALVEAQAGSSREAMAVNTATLDFMEGTTRHNQV